MSKSDFIFVNAKDGTLTKRIAIRKNSVDAICEPSLSYDPVIIVASGAKYSVSESYEDVCDMLFET